MTKQVLLIHPTDSTTAFLSAITNHIRKHIESKHFKILELEFTDESHNQAIVEIAKNEYSSIVFLGHGTAWSLRGSKNINYKNETFITSHNFSIFKGKSIILVSCESATLLRKNRGDFKNGVGFGDLPTDLNDISAARESVANAYDGFTQNTINSFQKILVNVIRFSLAYYIGTDCNMITFRDMIALRINKTIAENYINRVPEYLTLNECLLRVKQQLTVISN